MAVQTAGTAGGANVDLVNSTAPMDSEVCSWTCWYYHNGAPAAGTPAIWLQGDADSSPHFGVQVNTSHQIRLTEFGSSQLGTALTPGTWYHIGYTIRDTGPNHVQNVYVDGVFYLTNTGSVDMGVEAFEALFIGGSSSLNGRVAHFKGWNNVELTAAEIQQEMRTIRPVRVADLWRWTPLWSTSDMLDYSGNGRGWTIGGTVSTADGPPVSWGSPVYQTSRVAAAAPTSRLLTLAGVG